MTASLLNFSKFNIETVQLNPFSTYKIEPINVHNAIKVNPLNMLIHVSSS